MRQFVLPQDWDGRPELLVRGTRARYLLRVLRLREGDAFVGMDASGCRWLLSVLALPAETEALRLKVEPLSPGQAPSRLGDLRGGSGRRRSATGTAATAPVAVTGGPAAAGGAVPAERGADLPPTTLIQGLPKGAKMDLIVRQATEAGVARIVPLVSRRCAVPSARDAQQRLPRWERIVREALQQSGSAVPTRLDPPIDLETLISRFRPDSPGELRILFHETPLEQASLHGYLTETPERIVLCVGPEGGFAEDEAVALLEVGFRPLRLAGAILRAETAALFALASVNIVLSERSAWMPKPL